MNVTTVTQVLHANFGNSHCLRALHVGSAALAQYCSPLLKLRVDEVEVADVLEVLKPLWQRIPETASRVRMRLEKILDYAKAKGWRTGENPARWRGHLDHILPPRKRLTRGHHKAMPHKDAAS